MGDRAPELFVFIILKDGSMARRSYEVDEILVLIRELIPRLENVLVHPVDTARERVAVPCRSHKAESRA